jgi:hypothetical protein
VSGASCLGGLRWCLAQALQRADDDCAHDAVLVVERRAGKGNQGPPQPRKRS